MNTTPGTSVATASFERLRACRAARWSSHELSSMASRALERRRHDHQADDHPQGRPEPVDLDARQQVEQQEDEQGVEDDGAEPERQDRERDDEERQRRPHERVGDADDEAGQQRIPARVDREARQDGGEQPQREGGDDREDDAAPQDRPPRRVVLRRDGWLATSWQPTQASRHRSLSVCASRRAGRKATQIATLARREWSIRTEWYASSAIPQLPFCSHHLCRVGGNSSSRTMVTEG